jgi:hypothetical protein
MGSLSIGGVVFYVIVTLVATEKQKSLKKRIYQKENNYNGKELGLILLTFYELFYYFPSTLFCLLIKCADN